MMGYTFIWEHSRGGRRIDAEESDCDAPNPGVR